MKCEMIISVTFGWVIVITKWHFMGLHYINIGPRSWKMWKKFQLDSVSNIGTKMVIWI
jgi:hypothetical protein